jgi:hypothetical protein
VAAAVVPFAAGTWFYYTTRGLALMTLAFVAMTVFALLGVVEALVDRVVLDDDALRVIRIWYRRTYPRTEIAAVSDEKGGPVAVRLADGRWIKLPSVGSYLGNSIRAWLRPGEAR